MKEETQITLKVQELCAHCGFSKAAISRMRVDSIPDIVSAMLVFRLRAFLWGEEQREETHEFKVSYPLTAWEHFKRDYMLGWFTRLFPVKMKTEHRVVTFTQVALLPKFATAFDGNCEYVTITKKCDHGDLAIY